MKRVDHAVRPKVRAVDPGFTFYMATPTCADCMYCMTDPFDHSRKYCFRLTRTIYYPKQGIDADCPLTIDIIEEDDNHDEPDLSFLES